MIRQRPQISPAPHGPSSEPTWLHFCHPANDFTFLQLPALDWCHPSFGLHHGTAITACQILACNGNGYLSTSRHRHANERINIGLDSILPPGSYYYHLSSEKSKVLYPICSDFSHWKFPHKKLPPTWENELPKQIGVWPSNWTAIDEKVKIRDTQCLISESQDCLTTSHVIPKINEKWLHQNQMRVYLNATQSFLSNSSSNLFALRWDLHLGLFDQARFVIVPKLGKLVVHFLQPTPQSAELYHNIQFNHQNTLSHEALYARFAWALMKIVNPMAEEFTASGDEDSDGDESGGADEGGSGGGVGKGGRSGGGPGGSGGGGRGGHGARGRRSGENKGGGHSRGVKRKRKDENKDDESHYGMGATSDPGSDWRSGNWHVTSDTCPQEDGSQLLLDSEAREFEEDMKTAALTLPFFVDPNVKASAGHYENITWYPGSAIVDRRKQAYFDAHPQIRAHSDQLLPDEYTSDDENLM